MGRVVQCVRIFSLVCFLLFCGRAYGNTIDFEGLTDGTSVGSYYTGVSFTNATVLSAGISLNEVEFPPHSGQNVATDSGGAIRITFSSLIATFSGYFTYTSPLVVTAFDSNGILVGTATSSQSSNYSSSGNTPNELLSLSYASGIQSLLLSGDPGGGSFVVDDINYTSVTTAPPPPPPSTVPEPPGLLLLSTGLLAFLLLRWGGLPQGNRFQAVSRS